MKKYRTAKLMLHTQTLRLLSHESLDRVAGGDLTDPPENGFIMKDSIIVRTSTRIAMP